MTESVSLGTKLSGILEGKDLPEGYDDILGKISLEEDNVTTDDDTVLSDSEIQQVIELLNTHAESNHADAETIYQITQALAGHLHGKGDEDKIAMADDNYGLISDYDGRAELARYLANNIQVKQEHNTGWIRGTYSGATIPDHDKRLIQSLTTDDHIIILNYLADTDGDDEAVKGQKQTALTNIIGCLLPTQKAHIFAELETGDSFLTLANSIERSQEFQKNKADALIAALPTADTEPPPTKEDYELFNKIYKLGDSNAKGAVIDELQKNDKIDETMALALMNAAYENYANGTLDSYSDIDIVMSKLKELEKLENLKADDDTATYYFDTGWYSGSEEGAAKKTSEQKSDLVNLLKANNFAGAEDIETSSDDVPHLKAFKDFLGTLPITDDESEQTDPVESLKDYLETNSEYKDDIFQSIANGDLQINTNMEFFWNYLREQGDTEQKAFLADIEPYSPVHLSLIQTLKDHNADLDDEDDLSSDEKKYWEALQELSDAIGTEEKDFSDVDMDYIFPQDDDDIQTGDVTDAIFGNVSDTADSDANSLFLSDFMVKINKGEYATTDIEAFIGTVPTEDISEFSSALLSDDSPFLSIIQNDNDEETLQEVVDNLFTVLSNNTITHQQRMEFLKGINPDSEFFSYLKSMGYVQITDIIKELYDEEDDTDTDTDNTTDYSEYDAEMIQDFFENDINKVTKVWYGASVSTDYIDDLTSATDEKEMSDILEKAEDAGVLESVLYSISADSFEGGSSEFYNIFFKTLDKNNDYADIFMNSISPNSNLGRTFVSLSDNQTPPFDKISYDVDSDTGNIDFGGSENKLLKIISDSDLVGASVFYNTFSTIQSEYDDAVGTDNSGIRKLQDEAVKKNLSNDVFDDIFLDYDEEGKLDTGNAEEILEIIADDESILFKTLGEAELSHFIDKFLSWLASQDNALQEAFCDNLSEDSLIYKAMIKGGADASDFEDGAYQDFINSVSNSDDVAKFIKDYNRLNQSGVVGLGFVPEMLKGTKGSDIDDAVDDIIAYATADGQAMDDLVIDIANGGGVLATLETEQAKTLTEEIFAYILSVDPEDDEDISETALLFLDNIAAGSAIYTLIQQEYPAIANYLGASVADDDTEYDDKDIVSEMKKLLNNKQLINSYISQSTGTNETGATDDDSLYLPEDEDTLVADNSEVNDTQKNTTDTDKTGVFASDDMDSATDAALKAMSSRFEVSGEPDFETNTLSSFFFEEHSVKDLADAAYNDNYDTKQVIGTLQLIPLDKQPDFIREYMANGNIDEDTQSFLLGRLLTMTVHNEVGERTVKSILEDAGINALSYDSVVDIMDNWSEVMSQHTDVSITMIDDTYEQVLQASEKLKESDEEKLSGNPNNPNMPNGQYPYGGMPYGMGGMGMGGMMGGMGMYGMGGMGMGGMMGGMGMYGMGGMGAANPMMMAQAYNAGVMAGAQMAQGGVNTTAMMQPQMAQTNMAQTNMAQTNMAQTNMAQTNMAQTQMMQPKDNIVINTTDTFQGNVNLNITPDGSVNIQKTSAPPIAQTTQAPQQANVSKFTPKNSQ